ncbi:MAG: Gfo/Idh/MocA family oxidoreductase [Magnetococcales bacterium]|nr:Gfo/Idh/MocA family oxidoreductase [Magnetococcales bacterium]
METLRAGVIGVGYLGRFHAEKYARIPGVALAAIADTDAARGQELANRLGAHFVANYHDLFGRVDLVSICVPTPLHHGVTQDCLQADLHVLVEKPLTRTTEEAEALIALAAARRRVLQVGHLKRFHPAIQALRRSGLVTRPRFVRARRLAPFKNRALDVDVCLDLMIHDCDLVLEFMPAPLVHVEAIGARILSGYTDLAQARLRFADGSIAQVEASRVSGESLRRLELFQEESLLEVDFIGKRVSVQEKVAGRSMELAGIPVPEVVRRELEVPDYDTLEAQIASFCHAVASGGRPLVSGEEGLRALQVVQTIQAAIADQEKHFHAWWSERESGSR